MNDRAVHKLQNIKGILIGGGYNTDIELLDKKAKITASTKDVRLNLEYDESGDRGTYSLYDLDLIVSIDSQTYIAIYSERQELDLAQDFTQIKDVLDAIEKKQYVEVRDRFMLFWKRYYLKIKTGSGDVFLLRTR